MIPRWLQVQLALTLWAFWALVAIVGGSAGLSYLTRTTERAFTNDERAYLVSSFAGGQFIAPSQYKYCDGRVFMYFDSRGDVWNHGESCWRVGQ